MKSTLFIILLGVSITSKAIKPDREYKRTPDMRGLAYEEYQVKTSDQYSINIWEYKLPDSIKTNRTVILVGPDAGNISFLIWQAKALLKQGVRVIAFDYRGFGKSSDFAINTDFLFYPEFGLDLDSVIKATREKYPQDKVGLYAISMGTHISLLRKEKISFYIAEGFFHDPQIVVDRIKSVKGKTVLLPPNAKSIAKSNEETPTLIFCATKDQVTTTADAREFSKKNKVTLIEFEGEHLAGMNVFTKDEYGDEYAKRMIDFLNKSLQ